MRHAFVLALLCFLAPRAFAQDSPIPPRDAEWTIYCTALTGPDHVRQSRSLRVDLVKRTGQRDWYLVQSDADSKLFYGFYRTVESAVDKKESARAKADLHKIQDMQGPDGEHPFARAGLVQIIPPDPDGPPEWNLANLNRGKAPNDPTRAFFTLQIAAYKDSPERKKAAVDSVRDARARGIEAYYYHGESISSVCIGAWPKSAVKEQDSATGQTADSSEPILVSNTPLSPQTLADLRKSDPSTPSRVMDPKFEPLDPTMIKAIRDYPNSYLNGEAMGHKKVDGQTGAVTHVPDPSVIVQVPEPQVSLLDAPPVPSNVAPPSPALARPAVPSGTGKLKSLDE